MKGETIQLSIEGMSCVSCAAGIEKSLLKLDEVEAAKVSFATSRARVSIKTNNVDAIIEAINEAGYRARILEKGKFHPQEHQHESDFWSFAFAALFTTPLLMQMLWQMFGLNWEIPGLIQGVLATIVQLWLGWRFYEGAYYSIKYGSANMDALIATGTTAAYAFSFVVYFFQLDYQLHFESSGMIITLVLLGRWLEGRAKGQASEAIHKFMDLQPKTAQVEVNGEYNEIPVSSIKGGDVFLVRAGENIAVDGKVIQGSSSVDESMLTGESALIMKLEGDNVFGGTSNQNGTLKVEATRVGRDTLLSRIIRLVEQAQNSKAPIQVLADLISSVFVPVVVSISAVTFIVWALYSGIDNAVINAVAVLVIASPSALGLATPIVIMVASGIGANKGILFREAEAMQKCEKLNTIILDKTETLTQGKPQVTDVFVPEGSDEFQMLKIAMTLEGLSQHPLASAILSYTKDKGLRMAQLTDFESLPGRGLQGKIEGKSYYIGSRNYALECGIDLNFVRVDEKRCAKKNLCFVWDDQELLGALAIADALRETSVAAVRQMKAMGMEVMMLTGDHYQAAQATALELGLDHFEADLLPEKKSIKVQAIMGGGSAVGMVGDGIKDGPALAAASVGFAIGAGSDIAIEPADVTLLQDDLLRVVDAINLSRETMIKIRQNLFFAFIYNSLGIPLAALGFLNPVIAAAAMAMSSFLVVRNALFMKKIKI